MIQLFEDLPNRMSTTEFELFLVQARFIWNQRNTVKHGGKLRTSGWLNKRSREYLEEFHQAQDQLIIPVMNTSVNVNVWHPPPASVFKLNFDAAFFWDLEQFWS